MPRRSFGTPLCGLKGRGMFYRIGWVILLLFAAVPWAVLFFMHDTRFDGLDRRAHQLLDDGKYLEAVDVWEKGLDVDPRSVRARVGIAVAYSYADRDDLAEKYFAEAVELGPKSPLAWHEYGLYKLRKDDLDGAEKAFKKTIEADPSWYGAHYHLGLVYEKRGMMELAKSEWVRELNANPAHAVAMLRLRKVTADEKLAKASGG